MGRGSVIVIDPVNTRPAEIKAADRKYLKEGKWKCPKSPTGAHFSVDGIEQGFLVCLYCGYRQKILEFPPDDVIPPNPHEGIGKDSIETIRKYAFWEGVKADRKMLRDGGGNDNPNSEE